MTCFLSILLPPHLSHKLCIVLGLSYLAALCNLHGFHSHFFDISSPEKTWLALSTHSPSSHKHFDRKTLKMHTLTKNYINNICKLNILMPSHIVSFALPGMHRSTLLARSHWPQGLLAGRGNAGCGMCVFPFMLGLNQQAYIQKWFWFHFLIREEILRPLKFIGYE